MSSPSAAALEDSGGGDVALAILGGIEDSEETGTVVRIVAAGSVKDIDGKSASERACEPDVHVVKTAADDGGREAVVELEAPGGKRRRAHETANCRMVRAASGPWPQKGDSTTTGRKRTGSSPDALRRRYCGALDQCASEAVAVARRTWSELQRQMEDWQTEHMFLKSMMRV